MKSLLRFIGLLLFCIVLSTPIYAGQQQLTHSNGNIDDSFGESVAIEGDKILVGSPYIDDLGLQAGAVYAYSYDGSVWSQSQQLLPTSLDDLDFFGASVAINGDFAIVGAYGTGNGVDFRTGKAFVYRFDGSTWNLYEEFTDSSGNPQDDFGIAVAIAGDYAFVGAPGDDDNGTDSGAVFVYYYNGTSWGFSQKLMAGSENDAFGRSISVDGAWAAIGAYGDDASANESGAVYGFRFTGTTWQQDQKIKAGDPSAGDLFGFSVAIDGQQLLIGAPNSNAAGAESGSVYVFGYENSNWEQQEKITASDGSANQLFGNSLDISRKYAVVGATRDGQYGTSAGAAYLLFYNGRTWVELLKFVPEDASEYDIFGYSVALTEEFVITGAPRDKDTVDSQGAAYVFDDIASYRPLPTMSQTGMILLLLFLGRLLFKQNSKK